MSPPISASSRCGWLIVLKTAIPLLPSGTANLLWQVAVIPAQDNTSLANSFPVSFVWLGTGTPGAQPFEVFDADFFVIDTGSTSPFGAPAIPEPGSLLLVAGALGLLGWRNRRC